jgi:hypothetical protein
MLLTITEECLTHKITGCNKKEFLKINCSSSLFHRNSDGPFINRKQERRFMYRTILLLTVVVAGRSLLNILDPKDGIDLERQFLFLFEDKRLSSRIHETRRH